MSQGTLRMALARQQSICDVLNDVEKSVSEEQDSVLVNILYSSLLTSIACIDKLSPERYKGAFSNEISADIPVTCLMNVAEITYKEKEDKNV